MFIEGKTEFKCESNFLSNFQIVHGKECVCVCVFVMWNRFSLERHLMLGIKFVFFFKKRNYLPINTNKLTVEDSYLHPD